MACQPWDFDDIEDRSTRPLWFRLAVVARNAEYRAQEHHRTLEARTVPATKRVDA